MSAYSAGVVRFHLKSTANLLLEMEGPQNQKAGVTIPSTGGQWKEFTYPLTTFTNAGVSLGQIYGLFLITSQTSGTFSVDNVRWLKTPLSANPSPVVSGQWGPVIPWTDVPIHLHLLPTGNVMFWDRHDDALGWNGDPGLWNPGTGVFSNTATVNYDLFCSGHAFLPDGRLFVSGGHVADLVGEDKASIYDPFANSWTSAPKMNAGRWYPTSTILANGDVLTLAGTIDTGTVNTVPQVWQASNGAWRNLTTAVQGNYDVWADLYPWMYLAPNGKVFNAGPQQVARYLDTSGTGAWSDAATSAFGYRDYGTSVMYDDGKVLIAGGNPRDAAGQPPTNAPTATVEVIDLNAVTPAWRTVPPMFVERRQLTATLLPDGQVLVTGGSCAPGHDQALGAVAFAEMWNPATETWTLLGEGKRYRGYHSAALLLPDARVLVTGGGHPDSYAGAQTNAEIYSPPYLFKGARPAITSSPSSVTYGQTFTVQTPDAASIMNVNWIRLGSVTHAFNQNQRINRLGFTRTSGALNVMAPSNPNLCPPGDYMLFILNGNGVPSLAKIVKVAPTLIGATDFNADRKPDLVLFNASTLHSAIWYMNGPTVVGQSSGVGMPSGWAVIGVADFNGDGKPDYLVFNASTLRTVIFYLDGPAFVSAVWGPSLPAGWSAVGAADFNGDGKPDLVLFNASTLRTAIWYLNGAALIGKSGEFGLPSGWALVGVADFNDDGKPDYVLFNASTHRTVIYYLNGATFVSAVWGPSLPAGWSVIGAADFNSDGKPDYLVFNAATLRTMIFYMNGPTYVSPVWGPTLPDGWSLVAP